MIEKVNIIRLNYTIFLFYLILFKYTDVSLITVLMYVYKEASILVIDGTKYNIL